MRKIVVSEFMSPDGVLQAPGGPDEDTEGGFAHGGWTGPYWHDEIGAHFAQVMSESDAFLAAVPGAAHVVRAADHVGGVFLRLQEAMDGVRRPDRAQRRQPQRA